MRNLLSHLFFLAICACTAVCDDSQANVRLFTPDMLVDAVGDKVTTDFRGNPFPHLVVFAEKDKGRPSAYLFNSGDMQLSRKGLKGPIDVYLLLDPSGKILSVMIGDNKEVPSYLQDVAKSDMLKEWKGRKNGDPVPDAVSGATYTSDAVNGGVAEILSALGKNKFFD